MKTITINWKYLKYLFWLGPILSIMGISARLVSGNWSPITVGLLISGLVMIGLWLLFLGSLAPGFWGRRSTQEGTNALIATLSMIVILGLINFLGVRYAARIDLTENQLFTLSPLSQQVVKNLEQPVKVWIFDLIPNPTDRELLENYRRYGARLEFEFVDPQVQLSLAQKFNVQYPGEVYLEYGTERQLVQTVNDTERLSEVKLTNAIERITSDRTDIVYFLQGHEERPLEDVEGGLSQAVNALKEKNFNPQPLNLAERREVPKDASLVIIANPKRALFESEVQALREYLSQGGSLLVMVDPDTNPGLDTLLADWGVTLDNQIVIDASPRLEGLNPATALVLNYGNHPITQNFGNGFSLYPVARPVETKPVEGIKETPLILTNEQSWGENTPEDQPLEFNEEKGDRPGPLVLGVALSGKVKAETAFSQPKPEPIIREEASPTPETTPIETPNSSPTPSPDEPVESSPSSDTKTSNNEEARLVVYGNSTFVTNGLFDQPQVLNSDIFLNSVSWLSKRDKQALSIRPKEQENRRINLTSVQAVLLSWAALVIVPLLGFATAGIMWWRRR